MKAIITTYHGPTNVRGARITASDGDGNRATVSYPHEFSGEKAHWPAVEKLCARMGWSGALATGAIVKDGRMSGYAWVWLDLDGSNTFAVKP